MHDREIDMDYTKLIATGVCIKDPIAGPIYNLWSVTCCYGYYLFVCIKRAVAYLGGSRGS
jgi:hypothetical protein